MKITNNSIFASLLVAAMLLLTPLAQASVLTFDGTGTNVNIPASWASNIAAAGTGFNVSNGATPNITLAWSASGTAIWQFYNDAEWSGGQLDTSLGGSHDILFTPDVGYGVIVDSFVYDDYAAYAAGSTFDWTLYQDDENGAVIVSGTGVVVADGQNLLVNTGMASVYAGPVLLRITTTAGNGDDEAVDDITFRQAVVSSIPPTLTVTDQTQLPFATQTQGAVGTANLQITVENSGSTTSLEVYPATFQGISAVEFTSDLVATQTLTQGQSLNIGITWNPADVAGTHFAELVLAHTGNNASPVTVDVSAAVSGTTSTITFDRTLPYVQPQDTQVTIGYTHNGALLDTTPQAPTGTDWIGIYDVGDTPGVQNSLVFSYTNGTNNGSVNFNLGVGTYEVYYLSNDGYNFIVGPVTLSIVANSLFDVDGLGFGSQLQGSHYSTSRTITINNDGEVSSLEVNAALAGADLAEFSFTPASLTIAAKSSANFIVTWDPTVGGAVPNPVSGSRNTFLVLDHDDGITSNPWAFNLGGVIVPAAPPNGTQDLMVHLEFRDNLQDTSGRNNHAARKYAGTDNFTDGPLGRAWDRFAGGDIDQLTLGAPTDIQFADTGSFTVATWARFPGDYTGWPVLITNKDWGTGANPGWLLGLSGASGAPTANIGSNGPRGDAGNGAADVFIDNRWHHVAMSVDRASQRMELFVDGNLVATDTDISNVGSVTTATLPTEIGTDIIDNYDDKHLQMDDIGIWARALSQYEIDVLFYFADEGGQDLSNLVQHPHLRSAVDSFSNSLQDSEALTSSTVIVSIRNTGSETLNVGSLSVTGGNASDEYIIADPSAKIIAAGQTVFVTLTWSPDTTNGGHSTFLTATTNDTIAGSLSLKVEGFVVNANATSTQPGWNLYN